MVVTTRANSRDALGVGLVDTLVLKVDECVELLVKVIDIEPLFEDNGLCEGVDVRVVLRVLVRLLAALDDGRVVLDKRGLWLVDCVTRAVADAVAVAVAENWLMTRIRLYAKSVT
jgi:hypothetical protein